MATVAENDADYETKVADAQGKSVSECKVRMSVPRNIALYRALGYVITKETMAENLNGISLPVVTMEKTL